MMTFLIKCRLDEYYASQGEEMRFRYTVAKVQPTNYREQNTYLLDQLYKYQQIPWIFRIKINKGFLIYFGWYHNPKSHFRHIIIIIF